MNIYSHVGSTDCSAFPILSRAVMELPPSVEDASLVVQTLSADEDVCFSRPMEDRRVISPKPGMGLFPASPIIPTTSPQSSPDQLLFNLHAHGIVHHCMTVHGLSRVIRCVYIL